MRGSPHLLIATVLAVGQSTGGAPLDDLPTGARPLGLAGAYVAVANTAEAVFLNPAGLARTHGLHVSLFYQRPFGLEELSLGSAAASLPLKQHRIGLGITTFGNALYRRWNFTLSYANHYRDKLFFGANARYRSVSIEGYGQTGTVGVDLGLLMPVGGRFAWGFFVRNLNRPTIGRTKQPLAQTLTLGLSTEVHPRLLLTLDIHKDVRHEADVRFGAEMRLLPNLTVRVGAANHPPRFAAGFGLGAKSVAVDYAFFTHNDLGLTHQASVSFHLQKSKPKPPPPEPVAAKASLESSSDPPGTPHPQRKIDLNTADKAALQTLPGIGPRLAERIINHRQKQPFQRPEDLLKVPGIGRKTLEAIQPWIVVGPVVSK